MGLLDNKMRQLYVAGNISLQDVHQHIDNTLGKKFKITFVKKGNVAKQMVGGSNIDKILIAKNAYHRTFISIVNVTKAETHTQDETYFQFDRGTLKWWLQALYSNAGFIGAGIIRLIYGSNKEFDNEIIDTLKAKYDVKEREINVGVSALWKKDNVKEINQ